MHSLERQVEVGVAALPEGGEVVGGGQVGGQAALEEVRNHRPDLVVTDVMMPNVDGYELIRRMSTFGFETNAHLDDGAMWPVAFAVVELTAAVEKRLGDLVKKAAG